MKKVESNRIWPFSIYFFENYDVNNQLKFNDRSYRIVVNTKSTKKNLPKKLKSLFAYINETAVDDEDRFIQELDRQVMLLNTEDNDWRREVMRLDREFALRERLAREEERKEIAVKLLKKGMPVKEIAEITGLDQKEIKNL